MKACTPTRFASSKHPHDLRSPPTCDNTRIAGTSSCGAALCGRRCAMGNGQRQNCSHALTPPGLMVTAATKCRCMKSLRLSSVSKKAVHECGEAIVDWSVVVKYMGDTFLDLSCEKPLGHPEKRGSPVPPAGPPRKCLS